MYILSITISLESASVDVYTDVALLECSVDILYWELHGTALLK